VKIIVNPYAVQVILTSDLFIYHNRFNGLIKGVFGNH